ncbi:hypothetical protein [Roseiflexus sp.]|uniref:hypothetical protein n=1 Tax=Roseiflexus sp. TaxID=2562120 RepID=UPI0021DF0E43|nr:hypothetical protein [Roseiflexus sp.]GIW00591.1 MAG: hypothetical protein KatS3mg058_1994 [Roseiflexus sp.]
MAAPRSRCAACGRTFRRDPAGVARADPRLRLPHVAAIAWALGWSVRSVAWMMRPFGSGLCQMMAWRDVPALAERGRRHVRKRRGRVVGRDGCGGSGERAVVAVGRDSGAGAAREGDGTTRGLVTDDVAIFTGSAQRRAFERQGCDVHRLRWVGRAWAGPAQAPGEGHPGAMEAVRRIVREPPPDGGPHRERSGERIRPLGQRKGPLESGASGSDGSGAAGRAPGKGHAVAETGRRAAHEPSNRAVHWAVAGAQQERTRVPALGGMGGSLLGRRHHGRLSYGARP